MSSSRTIRLLLFFFFGNIYLTVICVAQPSTLPLTEWKKKLQVQRDPDNKNLIEISQVLLHKDSSVVETALAEMQRSPSSNHYYKARIFWLRADQVYTFRYKDQAAIAKDYFEHAMREAYQTDDDYFIFSISWAYGSMMSGFEQTELSATYYLLAGEMAERLGKEAPNRYSVFLPLGEVLFRTREYEKCIYYLRRGLNSPENAKVLSGYDRMKYLNAIGQCYQQLGKPDSALLNYRQSMEAAIEQNDSVWMGINSGFMGQVLFLKKDFGNAKALLQYDYRINKVHEHTIAANTLQWLAQIDLVHGNNDSALLKLRQALSFIGTKSSSPSVQSANYLNNIYHTTTEAFIATGNRDSANRYFQLYTSLDDSLERLAALSSVKLAQLRIDYQKNYNTILSMEQEMNTETLIRNLIIGIIVLLSVIAFFYVNRQRLKHKYKEQLALQEKNAAEADMRAAKEQLQLFTRNLIEKTNLVEQLQGQLTHRELSFEQQELAASISTQTILTESDWEKFKSLFEKIYPGFFINLKEKVNDITLAEQRMAALTRLHLTTRQIGSILGISPNSVNKTRQRLRQRLNLESEVNIEEIIAKM